MLHFVQALDLIHDQLRIAVHAQPLDPAGRGVIERRDQRVIFGDVVRGAANIFSKRFVRRPVRTPHHHAVRRRAGIPARRAVNICRVRAFGRAEGVSGSSNNFPDDLCVGLIIDSIVHSRC